LIINSLNAKLILQTPERRLTYVVVSPKFTLNYKNAGHHSST